MRLKLLEKVCMPIVKQHEKDILDWCEKQELNLSSANKKKLANRYLAKSTYACNCSESSTECVWRQIVHQL